jgi:hypothetical protein
MYADDIALLSKSEDDLQKMLNIFYSWCRKWRMKVNINKTKVIHFRGSRDEVTSQKFFMVIRN